MLDELQEHVESIDMANGKIRSCNHHFLVNACPSGYVHVPTPNAYTLFKQIYILLVGWILYLVT